MDIQRRKGTLLAKAIDVDVGILKGCDRADRQLTTTKVIPTADKRAELLSPGTSGRHSSQRGPAGAIAVVTAIDCTVQINPVVGPGGVYPASTAVDLDIAARLQAGPRMSVLSHRADCQLISNAVVGADTESTGRKVVAVRIGISVDAYKVAKTGHPHTPAVLR